MELSVRFTAPRESSRLHRAVPERESLMRRPQRPFTVERKRGARAAAGERPQATPELMDFEAPAPQPQPFDHARAAAEALFGGAAGAARRKAAEENPEPASAQEPAQTGAALPGAAPGGGRILQSLLETAATTPEAEPEPAPRRRGRKPGSRNKPKAPTEAPARAGKANAPLFDFEDEIELATHEAQAPDQAPLMAAPAQAPALAPAPARFALRRLGRVERGSLPRAERWKARLPSYAR